MPGLFWVLILLLAFGFFLNRFLEWLNFRKLSNKVPAEFARELDEARYAKTVGYERSTYRFETIRACFDFVVLALVLITGGLPWFDGVVGTITSNPILRSLLFFGGLALASGLLALPFRYYHTFVIEENFGLNRTTRATFARDLLKGLLLGVLIGGGLLWLILWFYHTAGPLFWVYAWILITGFSLFMAFFYSSLIVPLFNRQVPLEAGPLRDAIHEFCAKVGFSLQNIYVIDGSKRSSRANAYFTGFGPRKRIVLFDTLIKEMEIDGIVAVLAHEIGHYRKKHIVIGLISGILQTGLTLFIFSLFVSRPELAEAIGARPGFHIGALVFGILFSPMNLLTGLLGNLLSRQNEYEADGFAADHGLGEALSRALRTLSITNLSRLDPHPLYVFFYYSHPPVLHRIRAISGRTLTPPSQPTGPNETP